MMKMTGYLVNIVAIMVVILSSGVQSRFTSVIVNCRLDSNAYSTKQYCLVPGANRNDKFQVSLVSDYSHDARCRYAKVGLTAFDGKVFLKLTTRGCSGNWKVSRVGGGGSSDPDPPQPSKGSCGINKGGRNFRIIGGQYASDCQYPWMIHMTTTSIDGRKHYNCGGSLIDSKHVLTAAHCVVEGRRRLPAGNVKIRTGSTNRWKGTERGIEMVYTHEQYDTNAFSNDIAILRLRYPVKFDNCQSPICLTGDRTITPGRSCRVMGWGKLNIATGQSPTVMKWIEDPMASERECISKYRSQLRGTSVCGRAVSFCSGDSGGPLACTGTDNKYYQFGVVSIHLTSSLCSGPGKYTFVPYYKSWIDSKINGRY